MKKILFKRDFFPSAIVLSFAMHSFVLGAAGSFFISPDFSVTQGEQSVEFVVLGDDAPAVARQQRLVQNKAEEPLSVPKDSIDVLPDDVKGMISSDMVVDRKMSQIEKTLPARLHDPKIFKVEKTSSADQGETRFEEVAVHAASSDTVAQGAVVQGVLKDRNNPAPQYPHSARARGWEGVVYIKAFVKADGVASKVIVEKSSGYNVLDTAAVTAVENWHFKAARNGEAVLSSWVDIPVRFRLIDQPEERK